jgi:hypothetical protein
MGHEPPRRSLAAVTGLHPIPAAPSRAWSGGYPATILADICDVVLAARKAGVLQKQQEHIADQCEILVRGFARVGIIALVDEATGFQRDRAKDALTRILEAFIAKELRPWLRTFPDEFYQELYRLKGKEFPSTAAAAANSVIDHGSDMMGLIVGGQDRSRICA